MSTSNDVDDAMADLRAAITAYTSAGGEGFKLAQWLISQVKQSDPAVARALDNSITRFVAETPDRRPFATMG